MLPLNKGLSLVCDMTENAWSVAHKRHEFAGVVKGLNQCNRILAFCYVPHGAMSARVENCVEVSRFGIGKQRGASECLLRVLINFESFHGRCLILRQVAFRINRRLAAFWGHDAHFSASILENEIWGGELLQPNPGFPASVAELVMRG